MKLVAGILLALALLPGAPALFSRTQGGAQKAPAGRQKFTSLDRKLAQQMLRFYYETTRKYYYDPGFRGVNLAARYDAWKALLDKATSETQALAIVASYGEPLQDPSLVFIPAPPDYWVDYGFRYAMAGPACYVTAVQPGSDAAKKLQTGDRVTLLEGWRVDRGNYWKIQYILRMLAPRAVLHVDVHHPGGDAEAMEEEKKNPFDDPFEVVVQANVRQHNALKGEMHSLGASPADLWRAIFAPQSGAEPEYGLRLVDISPQGILIARLPSFQLNQLDLDTLWKQARGRKAVIFDLRGNWGGPRDALEELVSHLFTHPVELRSFQGRKPMKPETAKPAKDPFQGRVVVVVDDGTRGPAEVFARVVQIEKRGVVVGTQTAGVTEEARVFLGTEPEGMAPYVAVGGNYGALVPVATVRMSDGKSLEGVGVTPDEVVVPSQDDIAKGRDTQLAKAAAAVGLKITPEAAGKLLPATWQSW